MRLLGLNPKWIAVDEDRHGMGVSLDCQHCVDLGADVPKRIQLWFLNPIDGGTPAHPAVQPPHRWFREGDDFRRLTLTPAIDDLAEHAQGVAIIDGFVF